MICSFVLSVLIDQCEGYIFGICAETVAKRSVRQEENIVVVVARGTVERGASGNCVCSVNACGSVVFSGALTKRTEQEGGGVIIFFVCNGCGIFSCIFFSSVLLVSHVVVVHQRSFYSGVQDDTHMVLLVVLVQPGYYYTTVAKQVGLPAAAASDTCLCFNYTCLCD